MNHQLTGAHQFQDWTHPGTSKSRIAFSSLPPSPQQEGLLCHHLKELEIPNSIYLPFLIEMTGC